MIVDMLYETYLYLPQYDQIKFSGLNENCCGIWDSHFDKSLVNVNKLITKLYPGKYPLSALVFLRNRTDGTNSIKSNLDKEISSRRVLQGYNINSITNAIKNDDGEFVEEYVNVDAKHVRNVARLACKYGKFEIFKKYYKNCTSSILWNELLADACCSNNISTVNYLLTNCLNFYIHIEIDLTKIKNINIIKNIYDYHMDKTNNGLHGCLDHAIKLDNYELFKHILGKSGGVGFNQLYNICKCQYDIFKCSLDKFGIGKSLDDFFEGFSKIRLYEIYKNNNPKITEIVFKRYCDMHVNCTNDMLYEECEEKLRNEMKKKILKYE
jgi:hypothetical protein